jgi:hypothetical protein
MISIITTFDEIFNHILNMSWLYHFNSTLKIPLIWFHKECLDEIFMQTNIIMLKKQILLKIIFIWKITRSILEAFAPKSIIHIIKMLDWIKEKNSPKIIQFFFKTHFFGLKWPLQKNLVFQNANLTKMSTLTQRYVHFD